MTLQAIHLTSLEELLAATALWDDLWRRSEATAPTLRAALIAQWGRHFVQSEGQEPPPFRGLVVEKDGRWLAAMPLVAATAAKVLRVGSWPANQWSDSGDLLLDPAVEPQPVLDALAGAFHLLPWPLLRLADVPIEAGRWQQALAAFQRAGMTVQFRPDMQPGRIDTQADWEAYRRSWSRRHRQQMARHARKLAQQGQVELRVLDALEPDEVEPWLSAGFEIEDRGWKGSQGTSVRRTPGLFTFYLEQARELARCGELELALLLLDDRPIAFAYGMCAKGVYRSYKVGYDPEFARYSPGQLLRCRLLERFFQDERHVAVDYITPTPAHLRWRPEAYQIGRLLVARPGVLGRCLVTLAACGWPGRVAANERVSPDDGSSVSRCSTSGRVGEPGRLPRAVVRTA